MRWVASDLDGTLVRRDGTMSRRNVAALAACERAGVRVAFVTGRPARWLAPVVAATGHRGHRRVRQRRGRLRPRPRARRQRPAGSRSRPPGGSSPPCGVRRRGATSRWSPSAGSGGSPGTTRIAGTCRAEPAPVADLLDGADVILKILYRLEGGGADEMLAAVRPALEGLAEPVHSNADDCLLEIAALGVSKASTLAELVVAAGMGPEDVVAFGDMPNDVPMLRWAGVGYAMADGHPEAIAAADRVASALRRGRRRAGPRGPAAGGGCGMTPGGEAGLARRLGTPDAVAVGLGAMLGAGIFSAPGPAARAAGAWLPLAVLVAGLVAWCNATSTARLAAVFPRSGGTYVYAGRLLGPGWGHLAGWGFVTGKTASCAAMALTVGAYAWPSHPRPAATCALVVAAALGTGGVQRGARLTRVLLAVVLVVLTVVVAAGIAGAGAGGVQGVPVPGGLRRGADGGGPDVLRVRRVRAAGHTGGGGARAGADDPAGGVDRPAGRGRHLPGRDRGGAARAGAGRPRGRAGAAGGRGRRRRLARGRARGASRGGRRQRRCSAVPAARRQQDGLRHGPGRSPAPGPDLGAAGRPAPRRAGGRRRRARPGVDGRPARRHRLLQPGRADLLPAGEPVGAPPRARPGRAAGLAHRPRGRRAACCSRPRCRARPCSRASSCSRWGRSSGCSWHGGRAARNRRR